MARRTGMEEALTVEYLPGKFRLYMWREPAALEYSGGAAQWQLGRSVVPHYSMLLRHTLTPLERFRLESWDDEARLRLMFAYSLPGPEHDCTVHVSLQLALAPVY